MRFVLAFALATLVAAPAAFAATDKVLDAQQISALASKAAQAAPKEQCFMYAELAHSMLALASQQMSAGDKTKASASLKAVQDTPRRFTWASRMTRKSSRMPRF